jgi:nucleoside permease NupC
VSQVLVGKVLVNNIGYYLWGRYITKLDECVHFSDEINVFEATANGAAVASKTVAAVIGCYIAFLSLLAFINAVLSWLGGRVGFPELSFEVRTLYN